MDTKGYAYRRVYIAGGGRRPYISMHREIMGLVKGDKREVDHMNGDTLDNRRANLRVVKGRHEQMQNMASNRGSTSRFCGVSWSREKRKWKTQVKFEGRNRFLGYFKTEEAAAQTVDKFKRENFPFWVARSESGDTQRRALRKVASRRLDNSRRVRRSG